MYHKSGYQSISDSDEQIYGYNPPDPKNAHSKYENASITYNDKKGNSAVNIKFKHIPGLLRELREKGEKGWVFSTIFANKGQPMPGLQQFEQSLQATPTTALMDYWLLRLGGHIQILQGKEGESSTNPDALYLNDLYDKLVKRLQNYEVEMGKLANHPTRHKNEERQKIVAQFQQEWREAIAPAQKKYQEKDVNNILKNVAAACTVVGLLWLFCKNLYRLSQGKGLGLFQFEAAHSRKLENLEKLYGEIEKATAKDAEAKENYFSHDLTDAQDTCAELMGLPAKLQGLLDQIKLEKKEKKEITIIAEAYATLFRLFTQELAEIQSDPEAPDAEISLLEAQRDFMEHWQTTCYAQNLMGKMGEESPYPPEYQEVFQKMMDITTVFSRECNEIKDELESRQKRPSTPTHSDSGSSTF